MRISHRLLLAAVAALIVLCAPSAASAASPMVSAGGEHSCAVADSDIAWCWGDNSFGQLGDGTTDSSSVPVRVAGLPGKAAIIIAARDSTCVLLNDGSVWCWGANTHGQLGKGDIDVGPPVAHPTPTQVTGLNSVVRISGSERTFCVLLMDQTARCWGDNANEEIGNPAAADQQPTHIEVAGLTNVRSVSAGYRHSCALLNDGTARCWGSNANGMLGDGTTNPSASPVAVPGVSVGATIFAGGASTCATILVGSALCWGGAGYVGDGSGLASLSPKPVVAIAGASMLGGSAQNNCAVNGGQVISCWGTRPGNGVATTSAAPVTVPGVVGALTVTANGYAGHVCYLVRGGQVSCWGENDSGQLGLGGTSPLPTLSPAPVSGLDLVTGVYSSTKISVTRSGSARLDRAKRNYSQKLLLQAKLPALIGPVDGCTGRATATAQYKTKSASGKSTTRSIKATGSFVYSGDSCVAKMTLKLPVKRFAGKKIRPKVSWPGNGSITKIAATAPSIKLPKVKR